MWSLPHKWGFVSQVIFGSNPTSAQIYGIKYSYSRSMCIPRVKNIWSFSRKDINLWTMLSKYSYGEPHIELLALKSPRRRWVVGSWYAISSISSLLIVNDSIKYSRTASLMWGCRWSLFSENSLFYWC